jgi:hypothetical protein
MSTAPPDWVGEPGVGDWIVRCIALYLQLTAHGVGADSG